MRRATALALGLLGVSCLAEEGRDGRVPGTDLGRFAVSATLQTADCESTRVEIPDPWTFEVRLSRDDSRLFWLNGAAPVQGRIEPDGRHFSLEARVDVDLSSPDEQPLDCWIERTDRARGTLGFADSAVVGFAGNLDYAYSIPADSDCTALVGAPGGFTVLPCSVSYRMDAKQTGAPVSE